MRSTSLPEAALSNKKRFAFADSTQNSTIFSNCFSISLRASGASRFNSSRLEGSCSPAVFGCASSRKDALGDLQRMIGSAGGWDELLQVREEVYFTKGRIIVR